MINQRKAPAVRQDEIIDAALRLAVKHGYKNVTREQIGDAVGVTASAVSYHFVTMKRLRRCLMRAAVRSKNLTVILQGLTANDPQAYKADATLRRRAVESVL